VASLYREQDFCKHQKIGKHKGFILSELKDWDCLTIEVNLKVVALCKKKGTGEILQVEYEVLCEE